MAVLGQPQVQPTIPSAPTVRNWAQMQQAFVANYKLLSTLVLYLQTYLSNVYRAIVPSQLNPVTVGAAQSPYTVGTTDEFLAVSAGAASPTAIDLPPATGSGRTLVIKKVDANAEAVEVVPFGTDTIDGSNAPDSWTVQYQTNQYIDYAAGVWFKI